MERLLDVLRVKLDCTGPKEGCGEGECGSCSIFLNGELVNSCLIPVMQGDGAEIRTVEWLETDPLGRKPASASANVVALSAASAPRVCCWPPIACLSKTPTLRSTKCAWGCPAICAAAPAT